MTIFKRISLTLCGLLIAVPCFAQESVQAAFTKGNGYYEKGEFLKAAGEYEKVLEEGYESLPLYYNLGNSYFKADEKGKAILNYARALRLDPRDADLKSNYRFVKDTVAGGIQPEGRFWMAGLVKSYSDEFTVNELLWMTTALYILLIALLFVLVTVPDLYRKAVTVFVIVAALFVINSGIVWQKVRSAGREAVVIASEAESRYAPFETATAYFRLHEGMEVDVLTAKGGWAKIKRADGKIGWVPEKDIETI